MKIKTYLVSILMLCAFNLFAQFRMVGTPDGGWSTIDATTYSATINFQADLTGNSYVATQIKNGDRIFTPTQQVYTITNVQNATFSSAGLTIQEFGNTDGIPIGQVLVYDPPSNGTIPQIPFGSTGATAQMQAAVDAYNSRFISAGLSTANNSYQNQPSVDLTTLFNDNNNLNLSFELTSTANTDMVVTLPDPSVSHASKVINLTLFNSANPEDIIFSTPTTQKIHHYSTGILLNEWSLEDYLGVRTTLRAQALAVEKNGAWFWIISTF